MGNAGFVLVTVCDWSKFNPRTDSKNHTWFRFENSFFTKTFSWHPDEQRLFSYICCLCSQEKKSEIKMDLKLAAALLKYKESKIIQICEILTSYSVIEASEESNSKLLDVTTSSLVPTYVRTNDTNDTNSDFDFEKIYGEYPRKEGKTAGMKKCPIEIKSDQDYKDLAKAVAAYSKTCREERREKKFIKHFSSFMSTWRDYIPKAEDKKEPSKPDNWHTPEQLTRPSAPGPSVDVRELRRLADVTEIFRRNSKIE